MKIFDRLFKRKPKRTLRDVCLEKYGTEYVRKMDVLCFGEPIGNFQETVEFIDMLNEAKKELENENA